MEPPAMYRPMQERSFVAGKYLNGAENIGQHYYLRKFNADFSIEMNRSVNEMLKNWE